ncbi:MAG: rod shape-determining protein MreC [Bacilli bacterium]|nr:rod shape-determining protein MreC [Bacilli bacterium]
MNKKKKKISLGYMILLFVIIFIILIVFLAYSFKSEKKLNTFESIIKDSVLEIQKIVYIPFMGLDNMINDYNRLRDVLKENKILKSNVDKIESTQAENEELRQEIKKLKEELKIEHVLSDYDYLNATVVNRNSISWYNVLSIDKGSNNGVEEGMVVINSSGVIGKTTNVSAFSCDVRLITTTDTNNKISVSIVSGDKRLTGVINRYDYKTGFFEVEGISNTDKVSVGDVVYTSGLGGVFPSGILIGKVSDITTDNYDLAKIIKVTPSAIFDDINYVTILKRKDK